MDNQRTTGSKVRERAYKAVEAVAGIDAPAIVAICDALFVIAEELDKPKTMSDDHWKVWWITNLRELNSHGWTNPHIDVTGEAYEALERILGRKP